MSKKDGGLAFTCPTCGQISPTTAADLKEQYVACAVCHTKHETSLIRAKLIHLARELERDYVDYAKKVEL
jgi:hypothetical protein